jgi:hypothetical protein
MKSVIKVAVLSTELCVGLVAASVTALPCAAATASPLSNHTPSFSIIGYVDSATAVVPPVASVSEAPVSITVYGWTCGVGNPNPETEPLKVDVYLGTGSTIGTTGYYKHELLSQETGLSASSVKELASFKTLCRTPNFSNYRFKETFTVPTADYYAKYFPLSTHTFIFGVNPLNTSNSGLLSVTELAQPILTVSLKPTLFEGASATQAGVSSGAYGIVQDFFPEITAQFTKPSIVSYLAEGELYQGIVPDAAPSPMPGQLNPPGSEISLDILLPNGAKVSGYPTHPQISLPASAPTGAKQLVECLNKATSESGNIQKINLVGKPGTTPDVPSTVGLGYSFLNSDGSDTSLPQDLGVIGFPSWNSIDVCQIIGNTPSESQSYLIQH